MKLYTEEQIKKAFIHGMEFIAVDPLKYEQDANEYMESLTPIELPSNEEMEPVKVLEEDSDWYLIPNKLCDEFKNDTYNEEMVESGGFDDKWWNYKTGGDLNLIQLYVKIQGGNK